MTSFEESYSNICIYLFFFLLLWMSNKPELFNSLISTNYLFLIFTKNEWKPKWKVLSIDIVVKLFLLFLENDRKACIVSHCFVVIEMRFEHCQVALVQILYQHQIHYWLNYLPDWIFEEKKKIHLQCSYEKIRLPLSLSESGWEIFCSIIFSLV